MSSGGYKIRTKEEVHFLIFVPTTIGIERIDELTPPVYKDILMDSIRVCQSEKGLLLHACCLMTNHIHMLPSAPNNDPPAICSLPLSIQPENLNHKVVMCSLWTAHRLRRSRQLSKHQGSLPFVIPYWDEGELIELFFGKYSHPTFLLEKNCAPLLLILTSWFLNTL